jgi:hypothetical protein
MSLNTIQLTPHLLASLYKDVLIESAAIKPFEASIPFLGKNSRQILIVVSKENTAFLEEEETVFLTNILGACKLNIDEVAVVNQKNLPDSSACSSLIKFFKPERVLLFDVDTTSFNLPLQFPHFQIQSIDHCTYLSAPSLKEIEKEKAFKHKLWLSLKSLFGL